MKAELKRADMGEYLKLVPYAEVRRRIIDVASHAQRHVEEVPTDAALGRVSAEEVSSSVDIPEVSSSMMDGYAIRSSALRGVDSSHPVSFRLRGTLTPSSAREAPRLAGLDAYYVATGAPIPAGADAVVKVEESRPAGDRVLVALQIPKGKNIALKGEDVRVGAPMVRKGQIVNPADIALLIASGRRGLKVFGNPRVGILSTGDELTRPGSGEGGKKVNNYANLIAAYLDESGASPVHLGIAGDEESHIARIVENTMEDLDVLVTIGGSSVGKRDLTASALRSIKGCREIFHGIRTVPAKPTGMFALAGKPVVVLPGHAVAASLAFFLVVQPLVSILSGLEFDSGTVLVTATLSKEISNPRPVNALYLVELTTDRGVYSARPLRWGSNLVSSLAEANAFLQAPPRTTLKTGSSVVVSLLGVREIRRARGGGTE